MTYPIQNPPPSGHYPNTQYPNYPYPQSPQGPFRKSRFFAYLKLFAWLPALTLTLALALTAAYVLRQPPVYTSTASLMVGGEVNVAKEGAFTEEKQFFYGTQTELLRSDRLRAAAMQTIQAKSPELAPVLVELSIRQAPRSAIFELTATGPEPLYTKAFLSALIEEYFNFRKATRANSSEMTVEQIQDSLQIQDESLRIANEALAESERNGSLTLLKEQNAGASAYLSQLQIEADELRRELAALQEVATDSSAADSDSSTGNSDSMSDTLKAQYASATRTLAEKKVELASLAEFLKPAHPKIKALESEIQSSEKLVQFFLSEGRDEQMGTLQTKQRRLEGLLTSIQEWDDKVNKSNRQISSIDEQKRKVTAIQEVRNRLLNLLDQLDLGQKVDQEQVTIMEPVSTADAIPNGLVGKLLRAGMVGLFLGLGGVYLIEMTDDRLRSLTDVQNRFPQEVVGFIPKVRTHHGELNPIVPQDSRPAFAESWRTIRSALLFTGQDKTKPKTILVTSSVPAEGKSTVSVNLARTLALSGARVLLIDGDLRRGAIHEQLNLQSKPGFINCLNPQEATDTEGRQLAQTIRTLAIRVEANPDTEQKTSDTELLRKSQETLEEIVRDRLAQSLQQTDIPSLVFLARGSGYDDVGDLLLSPATDIVLNVAHEHFDHVIIDSAPVLAADDTSNIAPKVDGVLFVIRSSYSKGKVTSKALEALHLRQVPLLGLVLNRASLHASDGYYYRYKGYYDSKPSNGNGNGNGSSRRRSHRSSSPARSDKPNIPIVGLWKDQ